MTPHPAIDALSPPEGVTPGPWEARGGAVISYMIGRPVPALAELWEADATHIARMDPATTNALLGVVELLLVTLDAIAVQPCPWDAPSDDCPCAHHWALKRKAEALALLDTITPRDEETDRG